MTVTNTLSTVQANDVKRTEFWTKRLLMMIKLEADNFVFTKLGTEENLPLRQGTTTVSFKRANSLPISSDGTLAGSQLTEGVAPVALKGEFQKVQASVSQYGNYMELTDVVDQIHFDDLKKVYQPELARIASEQKERKIIASFAEGSDAYVNSRANADAIIATDILTFAELRYQWLAMRNAHRMGHTKFGGKPVTVVHINVMQDLLMDADLLNQILVPGNENSPMKNGTLESYKAFGMYVQETLIAPVVKNTAELNVYTSVMLGKDPYKVINFGKLQWLQTGFTADKSDPLGQLATIGYKQWLGAKVIDPLAIINIYSASGNDVEADFTLDAIGATADQTVA